MNIAFHMPQKSNGFISVVFGKAATTVPSFHKCIDYENKLTVRMEKGSVKSF